MSKRKTRRSARPLDETAETKASAASATQPIPFWGQLVLIGFIALALRVAHVLTTVEVPTVVHLVGDAAGYFAWAERIAGGQWFGKETFYQAPLYPYFLALLMSFGSGVMAIRLTQAMLGTVGVVMIGLTSRDLFTQRVGLIAAAMMAIYPPAIYYDGIVQKTSLASLLLCMLLAACTWLRRRPTPPVAGAIGLLLGLLVLTRENALLWLPIVPLWLLLGGSDVSFPRRGCLAGSFVLGAALVLLPVAARNAYLGGEWSPTTFQAGPNFYIGNNAAADGIYRPLVAGREIPLYERADAVRLAEAAEGRKLTARGVSRFWMSRACDEIAQAPGHWVQLMIQKSFMVVNHFEVPDVEGMYIYRQYSPPLRLAPLFHFGVLGPLAVVGMVSVIGRWRELWLYYVLVASMIAAIVLFFILGRYRQPLVPLLIPFAAAGIVELFNRLRRGERSRCVIPMISGLLAAVICNLPVHDEQGLDAASIMNAGVAAGKAGELGTSVQLLGEAVMIDPSNAAIHFNLARAWSQIGRPGKAMASYRNALLIEPNMPSADYLIGQLLEQSGDTTVALSHYRRAAAIDPDNRRALEAIARLQRTGDERE